MNKRRTNKAWRKIRSGKATSRKEFVATRRIFQAGLEVKIREALGGREVNDDTILVIEGAVLEYLHEIENP